MPSKVVCWRIVELDDSSSGNACSTYLTWDEFLCGAARKLSIRNALLVTELRRMSPNVSLETATFKEVNHVLIKYGLIAVEVSDERGE